MKITFQPVRSLEEIQELELVVKEIWSEVFTPIIGSAQVSYMLETYQSPETIQQRNQRRRRLFYSSIRR